MHASYYTRTKEAIAKARHFTETLLDLADVPDNHQIEQRVRTAFISLDGVLGQVPKVGRNASAIYDPGPVVYPVRGRDPRDWPTSEGTIAREAILQRTSRGARLAASTIPLVASNRAATRRVLSHKEYLEALEEAHPVVSQITESEDENSYSLITLAE